MSTPLEASSLPFFFFLSYIIYTYSSLFPFFPFNQNMEKQGERENEKTKKINKYHDNAGFRPLTTRSRNWLGPCCF
jgi:hypothetical protein